MQRAERRRKARKLMKYYMDNEFDKIKTTRQERKRKSWNKAIKEVREEDKNYN